MSAGNQYELSAWEKGKLLVGIDEAGRGPICGPLTVAGVVFPKGFYMPELDDSKKLSEKKREALFPLILKQALWYDIEIVSVETIDALDIYHATQQAMEKIAAVCPAEFVLTDAMPIQTTKEYDHPVKGDHQSFSIAAASILAKVTRDQIMYVYDRMYPVYDLAAHKGYPTKAHLEAIRQYGVNEIYRKSYAPVKNILGISS